MEEVLIGFNVAKLAKEKGFNILDSLTGSNNHFFKSTGEEIIGDSFAKNLFYQRVTQSLLQKWLREVHNIYVESYHDLTSDGENIQYYTNWAFISGDNVNGGYDEYNDWRTFEEALEEGLFNALELIKI